MPNERTLSKSNPYYLPRETYLTVIHWCRQYPTWLAMAEVNESYLRGVSYDRDIVSSSGQGDMTAKLAIKRARLTEKIDIIKSCAEAAGQDLAYWILLGTCYQLTYNQLRERGIPCGKDLYYKLRRKFYFELADRI